MRNADPRYGPMGTRTQRQSPRPTGHQRTEVQPAQPNRAVHVWMWATCPNRHANNDSRGDRQRATATVHRGPRWETACRPSAQAMVWRQDHHARGLCQGACADCPWAARSVRPRASGCDGAGARSAVGAERTGSPHQRRQARQPTGEPGALASVAAEWCATRGLSLSGMLLREVTDAGSRCRVRRSEGVAARS